MLVMGFFYGTVMTILEKIDFKPGTGKYEAALTLLNNQSTIECSENLREFFMNSTVNFLKNSILNDIMQVQPLEESEGILHYLRCIKPDDNSVSIQVLEDTVTVETYDCDNVYLLETLQDDASIYDGNLLLDSYTEFENRIIPEIVEQSNIILKFKKEYSNEKLILLLSEECNDIARRTRRGAGNIAIMSTDMFNTIADNDQFIQLNDDGYYYIMNIIKIKIHDALGDNILLGYNNNNNLLKTNVDGGGFFVPYRLFDNIRIVLNVTTLEPELHYASKYTTRYYDADKYYTTITLV